MPCDAHRWDDEEPLAFVYDGTTLVAKCYRPKPVRELEEGGYYTVSRTPKGEEVLLD